MLESIEIKGFRSFSQESSQKIDLQPFTIIVGENDTGKSNLLKAIWFALDPSTDSVTREDFNIRKSLSRVSKVIDKKSSQIYIKLSFKSSTRLLPRIFQKLRFNTKAEGKFFITCIAHGHDKKSYKKEYKLNNALIREKDVPLLLSKIKCYITPSIRDVNYLNELKKLLPVERSSLITQAIKRFSHVVKGKMKGQEALFKKATGTQKVFINPKLDSETVLNIMDFDFLVVKDDIPIQLKSHGQGMISKIIISLFLKRGANSIVGIEEPEIHIHPNLIREIVLECEKQSKQRTQIIIVTHSHYLVNFVSVKNILIAKKDSKYTKIGKIISRDAEVVHRIENNIFLNRQKTEILFAKGVLFVEGQYDRRALMEIDIKEKTPSFSLGINIVDVGGDDFFPYIELCIHSGIPWAIIADCKAFYSPENNCRGPLLKTLGRYIPEDPILRLENKIRGCKAARKELRAVNELLKNKKGYVAYLSGGDISETIINVLTKKNDMNLYKSLFTKYGGYAEEQDQITIKTAVETTIRGKVEQMIEAVRLFNKPNELAYALKRAVNYLARLYNR
jgi:predicted ATP-dependent endonuclease of OLD family